MSTVTHLDTTTGAPVTRARTASRMAPAGTQPAVLAKLNTEMLKIIKSPEFVQKMRDAGCEPLGSSPAEMAARIASETTKFAKIVRDGKLVVE